MKSITDILLTQLGQKARQGSTLRDRLAAVVPSPLGESLLHARADGSVLVVTLDSPGAATRMRFCQRALLSACRAEMALTSVKIKVAPRAVERQARPAAATARPPAPRLSAASSKQIESVANAVEHDRLQRALRRLASRTRD
ncbi:MAG: DciA family protein [Pseudomonadota bacterium]